MSRLIECQRVVLAILSPTEPLSEASIREEVDNGCLREWSLDDVVYVINSLHGRNKIRWVAFEGWCLGGRPS